MAERLRVWVGGLDHPEGVTVDATGQVYAGGEAGQIYAVANDEVRVIAETGGMVLGLACDAGGDIYACDIGLRQVVRIDPIAGSVSVHSTGAPDAPFRAPNYPAFDTSGNLFVTDSGDWDSPNGRTLLIRPDGSTTVWDTALSHFPNGCALAPGSEGLYVIESTRPAVSFIPFRADGSAGTPRMIARFPDEIVPDGVAVTADGDLIVACYRPDRLYLVTQGGSVEVLADDPHGTILAAPTNVVFAGDHLATMIIASLGRWHLTEGDLTIRGLPLNYPRMPAPAARE